MRSRPQPSAPWAAASIASASEPVRLANTSMRSPLARWQSVCAATVCCSRMRALAFEPLPCFSERRRIRIGAHRARIGIEDDLAAGRDLQQPLAHRHQHGDAERRGEDRDMRGGTAGRERDAGELRCIDIDELRRREIAREQDAAGRDLDSRSLRPIEREQHLPFEVAADRRRARPAGHHRWRSAFAHWRASSRARRSPRSCRWRWTRARRRRDRGHRATRGVPT